MIISLFSALLFSIAYFLLAFSLKQKILTPKQPGAHKITQITNPDIALQSLISYLIMFKSYLLLQDRIDYAHQNALLRLTHNSNLPFLANCSLEQFLQYYISHEIPEVTSFLHIVKQVQQTGGSLVPAVQFLISQLHETHRLLKTRESSFQMLKFQYYLFFFLPLGLFIFAFQTDQITQILLQNSKLVLVIFCSFIATQVAHHAFFKQVHKTCLSPDHIGEFRYISNLVMAIQILQVSGYTTFATLKHIFQLQSRQKQEPWSIILKNHRQKYSPPVSSVYSRLRGSLFPAKIDSKLIATRYHEMLITIILMQIDHGTDIIAALDDLQKLCLAQIKSLQNKALQRAPFFLSIFQVMFVLPLTIAFIIAPYGLYIYLLT